MALGTRGLLVCINFLAKKSKLKHSGTETDVQPIYADKNSSLACLSLTDEGSALTKEAELAQVEQSQTQLPLVQSTTEVSQIQEEREVKYTDKSTVPLEDTTTKVVQLVQPKRMCSPFHQF